MAALLSRVDILKRNEMAAALRAADMVKEGELVYLPNVRHSYAMYSAVGVEALRGEWEDMRKRNMDELLDSALDNYDPDAIAAAVERINGRTAAVDSVEQALVQLILTRAEKAYQFSEFGKTVTPIIEALQERLSAS